MLLIILQDINERFNAVQQNSVAAIGGSMDGEVMIAHFHLDGNIVEITVESEGNKGPHNMQDLRNAKTELMQ